MPVDTFDENSDYVNSVSDSESLQGSDLSSPHLQLYSPVLTPDSEKNGICHFQVFWITI